MLIRACLASILVYLLSAIKSPTWAIKTLNSQMAHCLWDDYDGHRKYHLANWDLLSMKREFGGTRYPQYERS